MNSHDIACMANQGMLRVTARMSPIAPTDANLFTIAESIRKRLNAIEGPRAPEDCHVDGYRSLCDERRVLRALEQVLDAEGY